MRVGECAFVGLPAIFKISVKMMLSQLGLIVWDVVMWRKQFIHLFYSTFTNNFARFTVLFLFWLKKTPVASCRVRLIARLVLDAVGQGLDGATRLRSPPSPGGSRGSRTNADFSPNAGKGNFWLTAHGQCPAHNWISSTPWPHEAHHIATYVCMLNFFPTVRSQPC